MATRTIPVPRADRPWWPARDVSATIACWSRSGSGANGSVWKAIDEELDRVVALKIPHTHRATADFLARFSREARVVARLRHPGIVTLHEVLQWEGRPVLVSDYVEGSPLDALLARRRLTPREAAEVAAKLAETLAYVHEMGAVHRDIKPANILIPRDGRRRPSRMTWRARGSWISAWPSSSGRRPC